MATKTGIFGLTARKDIHEITRELVMHLGPTLVATLAGVKSRQMAHRWAQPDGPAPNDGARQRLMAAHRIWTEISAAESDDTTRAWFIGANPRLGEEAPFMVLAEGRLKEALAAAQAFLDGTDD